MKEVAVLQVQPDAQSRLLKVTANARGEELMLEYLRRLGATGGFSEVHLLSHQVREDDPGRPVQFSVQASFRSGM
jgi:Tfp pilus assembly protein PilN